MDLVRAKIEKIHKFWASADTWGPEVIKDPKYLFQAARDLRVITTAYHEIELKLATVDAQLKDAKNEIYTRTSGVDGIGFSYYPGMKMKQLQRLAILHSLKFFGGNKTHASKSLGMSIRGFRLRVQKYIDEGSSLE